MPVHPPRLILVTIVCWAVTLLVCADSGASSDASVDAAMALDAGDTSDIRQQDADGCREPSDCDDGERCDDGSCVELTCEPLTSRCDGNVVVECDAEGVSEVATPCAETEPCGDAEHGCSCDDGQCVERSCSPGVARCGDDGREVCGPDGLGHQAVPPCASDQNCVEGTCVDRTCEPTTRSCAGETLLICCLRPRVFGAEEEEEACCLGRRDSTPRTVGVQPGAAVRWEGAGFGFERSSSGPVRF